MPNIKFIITGFCLLLFGCYDNNGVTEVEADHSVSEQESFAIKLKQNDLLYNDSLDRLAPIIASLVLKTRFKEKFKINQPFDSSSLNFYILDSQKNSALRNLCAYAGNNTIFLDRFFLTHYLDSNSYLGITGDYNLEHLYHAFQVWVIGHEIAHADIGHQQGHFIKNNRPKTQDEAWKFHSLELQTDRRTISYLDSFDRKSFGQMLIAIFNEDFDRYLGVDPDSRYRYLKMDNDPYLTYPYKLDGTHSTMAIRTAIFVYLMTQNKILKEEAYLFLTKSQLHILKDLTDLSETHLRK